MARAKPLSASSALGGGVRDVEAEGRRDLVVAGAAGVDLAADVAEQALDRRVDVLVGGLEIVDGDPGEAPLDLGELVGREQPGCLEPRGVDQRSLQVVREQLVVGRAQELPHLRGEGRPDAPGPEGHCPSSSGSSGAGGGESLSFRCVSSMRWVSVMSLICTASWPIRSPAVNAVALRSMLSRSGS